MNKYEKRKMNMIRNINEEPVSFGSRLNQLMKEKKIRNEDIAELLGCSKTAVSDWRTGKHTLRRFKEDYCLKLSDLFDVDPEYLLCTQLEKRRKRNYKQHDHTSSGIGKKWFNSVNGKMWKDYDSIQAKRKAMKEVNEDEARIEADMNLQSEITDVFGKMGIVIEPEIIGSGSASSEYEILEDEMIKTVIQEEEYPRYSNRCIVTLPDGSELVRTAEEIIEIYQSMKDFCFNRFNAV